MPINSKQKLDHMIRMGHPIKHLIESCEKETDNPGLSVIFNSLTQFLKVYDGEDSKEFQDTYDDMVVDVMYIIAIKCDKILYAYKDLTTDKDKLIGILKKIASEDETGILNNIVDVIEDVVKSPEESEKETQKDPFQEIIDGFMGEKQKEVENPWKNPYKYANDMLEDPNHNDVIDNFLTNNQFNLACNSRIQLTQETEEDASKYCNARFRQLQSQNLFGK